MPAKRRFLTVLFALAALGAPLLVAVAPPAAATTSYEAYLAKAVLNTLNGERRANGRAPLLLNSRLNSSSRYHGLWMAKYNRLTHQFSGERDLGGREDYAGYPWLNCGENIAYTGTISATAVMNLEKAMYAERAPYDVHRQNILSWQYREVGISAVVDSYHHRVWLTVDFGRR